MKWTSTGLFLHVKLHGNEVFLMNKTVCPCQCTIIHASCIHNCRNVLLLSEMNKVPWEMHTKSWISLSFFILFHTLKSTAQTPHRFSVCSLFKCTLSSFFRWLFELRSFCKIKIFHKINYYPNNSTFRHWRNNMATCHYMSPCLRRARHAMVGVWSPCDRLAGLLLKRPWWALRKNCG